MVYDYYRPMFPDLDRIIWTPIHIQPLGPADLTRSLTPEQVQKILDDFKAAKEAAEKVDALTGQADCVAKAPPPPGDGCDQLQWWFDQLSAPTPPPGPPKVRPRLPDACYALFGWAN